MLVSTDSHLNSKHIQPTNDIYKLSCCCGRCEFPGKKHAGKCAQHKQNVVKNKNIFHRHRGERPFCDHIIHHIIEISIKSEKEACEFCYWKLFHVCCLQDKGVQYKAECHADVTHSNVLAVNNTFTNACHLMNGNDLKRSKIRTFIVDLYFLSKKSKQRIRFRFQVDLNIFDRKIKFFFLIAIKKYILMRLHPM